MSNNKMKGLLKGLRYISQIFDNEKEPEMQIGHPTDVKHVAHIGWDGPSPSVNSSAPSWMNEFKSPHEHSSAPLTFEQEKWVSEDSPRRGTRTTNSSRDLPELPKSSRRHSSTSNITDSPTKEKSDKQKSRRSSKTSKSREDGNKPTRLPVDLVQESASPSRSLPDIPKKTRRKKSKDSGGSTRLRSKAQITETYQSPYSDPGIDTESLPRPSDGGLSQKSFEEEDEKGFRGIS